jgi:hypothetical protein
VTFRTGNPIKALQEKFHFLSLSDSIVPPVSDDYAKTGSLISSRKSTIFLLKGIT